MIGCITQDMKRPSSRFGIVMRTVFTDIDWKNTLAIETGCCTRSNAILC